MEMQEAVLRTCSSQQRSAGSLARASPQKALRRRKHRRELCQSSICGTVLEISSFTPPPQKGATVVLKNSITAHIHEDPEASSCGSSHLLQALALPAPPSALPPALLRHLGPACFRRRLRRLAWGRAAGTILLQLLVLGIMPA